MQDSTNWSQVVLIIGAGVIGACQIGKVAIALPLLREDLGLSLVAGSWIAGAYAVIGLAGGVIAGFVTSFFSMHCVVVAGLVMLSLGSFAGATAPDAGFLIASRVLEGAGFLAIVVTCPGMLRRFVTAGNQQVVFGFWSSYIPIGALAMMSAGPFIMQGDWRWLWIVNGVLAAVHAVVFWIAARERAAGQRTVPKLGAAEVRTALTAKVPLILSGSFAIYTIQYFALATFLPTFLVERLEMTLAGAGTFSAFALAANAVGNIAAGYVLRRNVALWSIFIIVFVMVGLCGTVIFLPQSPGWLVALAAIISMGVTALLPASVIASMPRFAPSPPLLAMSMGLVQQASALGQLVGPALLALWAQSLGWSNAPFLFLMLGASGLLFAWALRQSLARPAPDGR